MSKSSKRVNVKGRDGTLFQASSGISWLQLDSGSIYLITSNPNQQIRDFPGGAVMSDIKTIYPSSAPSAPSSPSAPSAPRVPSAPSAPSTSIDYQLNFRPTGRRSYDINTSATRPIAGTFIPIPQMEVRPMESVSDLTFLQDRPTRGPKLVL